LRIKKLQQCFTR